MRRFALVCAFFLLIALVVTWPLLPSFGTHFAGDLPGPGDAYEYARHIWWFRHALATGQDPFFHPLLAYPHGIPGAHLWANALQSFPAWLFAFVLPLPAAFNLMIVLRLALNGLAMYLLVSALTSEDAEDFQGEPVRALPFSRISLPALLAGVVYMAWPTAQSHLAASHSGILLLWPFPLYALALLRLSSARARVGRWYGAAAGCFVIGCLGSSTMLIYVLAPLTTAFVAAGVLRRQWQGVGRVLLASALGGVGALPFLVPAALETLAQPSLDLGGSVQFSADLLALVTPSPHNPLFAAWDYPRAVLDAAHIVEGAGYVGVVAGGLALAGGLLQRKEIRQAEGTTGLRPSSEGRASPVPIFILLLLIAWVASLGPLLNVGGAPYVASSGGDYASYVVLPWALVEPLPLVSVTRSPARFQFALGLAVAALVGIGADKLQSRLRLTAATAEDFEPQRPQRTRRSGSKSSVCSVSSVVQSFIILFSELTEVRHENSLRFNLAWHFSRWPLWFILLFVLLVETRVYPLLPLARADLPPALYALAEREDIRAVFDVPWNTPVTKEHLYLQTAHQHASIAGQVTRSTPADPALLWQLETTLDPALLDAASVDVVIVHKRWASPDLLERARTRLGAPFYEDDRYALFQVPPHSG